MGFVGQVAPNFGIDNMVLFMRGPDDGWLRVALNQDSGIKLDEFRERLRKVLPERVVPWMAERLEKGGGQGGLPRTEARQQAELCTFGFEAGDIVSQVMSFGASKPIAVRAHRHRLRRGPPARGEGRRRAEDASPTFATSASSRRSTTPLSRSTSTASWPGLIGVTPMHLKHALVMATSSTRFTNLNYWINIKTGFDYLVQIQVPPLRMDKPEDLEELPLESVNPDVPLMVRDVLKDGQVHTSVQPGEYDRDMSQRYLTVVANVEGEDMGRAAKQVRQAVKDAGDPPAWRSRRGDGPAPVHDPDVQGAGDRPGGRRVRHPRPPDGLFPIPAPGPGLDRRRAGRARRDRDHAPGHRHHAQHRIVHGLDHVPGCLGVQLGDDGHVHGRALEGGQALDRGGHPGRDRTAAADPDDGLRDDRRAWCRWRWRSSAAARWRPRSAGP